MNCIEYYKQKYGIDISILPRDAKNCIATFYLEHIDFTKEELEEMIKEHFHSLEKSENVNGGTHLNSQK